MKDFAGWFGIKKRIHESGQYPFFHEGEIWWSALGTNVGFEEDGKNENFERPVLIFKKFNKEVFWGLPATTKQRSGRYYFNSRELKRPTTILLSQIRLLDGKRLLRKMGTLPRHEYLELLEKFRDLLQ